MSAVSAAGAMGCTVLAAANIGMTLFGENVLASTGSTALSFLVTTVLTVAALFSLLRLVALTDSKPLKLAPLRASFTTPDQLAR